MYRECPSFKHLYSFPEFFYLFIYLLFSATPVPYRNSHVRGQIGPAAADLCYSHSNIRPELQPPMWPTTAHSWQHYILNPMNKARDWPFIPHGTSQDYYCWTRIGTPFLWYSNDSLCQGSWPSCHAQLVLVQSYQRLLNSGCFQVDVTNYTTMQCLLKYSKSFGS